MPTLLTAIALLWLSSLRLWPLLVSLLICSRVWADGGSAAEVAASGIVTSLMLTIARRCRA